MRGVLRLLGGAALYGYAIGTVHSTTYAIQNLLKFPALLVITAGVCAPGFMLCARLLTPQIDRRDLWALVHGLTADLATLLASLAVVSLFMAVTIERPGASGLGEYPLFLGLNVVFIALSGTTAVLRRARTLLARHAVIKWRASCVVALWLGLSLAVGGQWAWYLRPFFGVATIAADDTPFCLGTDPDFRGDTSFYEAVYHLVFPP